MTERQPAGQPTGGQFAPTSGSDAGVGLTPERPLSLAAEFKHTNIPMGTLDDGSTMTVTIRAVPGDPTVETERTDHSTGPAVARLAFTGNIVAPNHHPHSGHWGQVGHMLDRVTTLAPGMTRQDLDDVKDAWDHHADTDAIDACDCMDLSTAPPEQDWPLDSAGVPSKNSAYRAHFRDACSHGHQYADKWLAREVPSEVFERMDQIGRKASG